MDNEKVWNQALGELELNISKANFVTWFKNTCIANTEEGRVTISVPNTFTKEWLEKKYHKEIFRAITSASGVGIKEITYCVGATPRSTQPTMVREKVTPKEAAINEELTKKEEALETKENQNTFVDEETGLNSRYVFESFIVGPSNELAHAAAKAISADPGQEYNPLFIYGGVGLGKTHLAQAVGNEIVKKLPNKKVRYVTSEAFTNEFIHFIRNQRKENFKNKYRNIDVLIVDDIQFIGPRERTQEEFFHTFNALYSNNKQIIISSDRPPKAIPLLEERLRSRFEGGMIADIGKPDFETRSAILREKSRLKGFEIPNDVLNYIAQHIQHNIRELEGALNRVIAFCQINDSKPTIENVPGILSSIIADPNKKATTPKKILDIVGDFYNLAIEDLTGKSRKREFVQPRQIAMFLMRFEIKTSFPSIGQAFGGKDHTTAMHACTKITKLVEDDETIKQEVDLIRQRLYSS